MKKFAILFSLLLSIIIAACSEQVSAPDTQSTADEASITQKTSVMVTSRNFQIIKTSRDDSDLWEVTVTMENGGIIKIEYDTFGIIREVKGLSGPFDYEFKPGNGAVDYSVVKANAMAVVPGNINFWKFEKDESENRFEYRFEIIKDGEKFEVRLNAITGSVTRIKD